MAISAIVLNNLTTTQLGWLKELANLEVSYLNDTVISRQPFQGALRSYLENPSLGLDYEKVIEYAAKMWDSDANLTLLRGEYYGKVIRDLSPVQIAYWNTWYNYTIWTFPNINVLMDNIHTILNGLTNDQSVEVQTFADDIFVQVTQPIYGDVYWAPERVSDYFGAFYLKDLGVVGVPNYTISVNATLNGGELFLDVAGPDAKKQINDVTTMETTWLYDWVTVRTMVATELRKWHTHGNINQTYVREYLHLNGMYDGMIAYLYAKAFTDIGLGLNSTQMSSLQANREPPFDITVCYTTGGAFFFAELKFDEPQVGNPPLDLFNDSTTSQDSLGTSPTLFHELPFISQYPVESWDSSAVSAGFTTEPAVVLFLLLFAIKTLACV
ncbi:periplasmic heavy metal sensor [Pelomyxa schiedti]|nr:periplasmic heavy metal sensor [Pelomyxa schiedti]